MKSILRLLFPATSLHYVLNRKFKSVGFHSPETRTMTRTFRMKDCLPQSWQKSQEALYFLKLCNTEGDAGIVLPESGFSHQLSVWCSVTAKVRALRMLKLPLTPPVFHSRVLLRQGVHVRYYFVLFLHGVPLKHSHLKRRQPLPLSLEMDFYALVPNTEGGKWGGGMNIWACMSYVSFVHACIQVSYLFLIPRCILLSSISEISNRFWVLHVSNACRKHWFLLNYSFRAQA